MKKIESISLCFPAYNEEKIITKTIKEALKIGQQIADDFEVVIVDDGSKDNTGKILDKATELNKNLRVIHHSPNKGYGEAVISGINNASKEYLFLTDSDLQFDLKEINKLIKYIKDYDVVIGYRSKRKDSIIRIINAKLWGLANWIVFDLKVKDIDCAFKLFRRDALEDLKLQSKGAMVSAEMLIKIFQKGYKVKEVPVTHLPSPEKEFGTTGARPKVIIRAFKELIQFKKILLLEKNKK